MSTPVKKEPQHVWYLSSPDGKCKCRRLGKMSMLTSASFKPFLAGFRADVADYFYSGFAGAFCCYMQFNSGKDTFIIAGHMTVAPN